MTVSETLAMTLAPILGGQKLSWLLRHADDIPEEWMLLMAHGIIYREVGLSSRTDYFELKLYATDYGKQCVVVKRDDQFMVCIPLEVD